nr:glycosyltransferase family 1 protein [Microbacterium bovistercoris]
MRHLVLATFASATIMGAQVYERAIDQRAQSALDDGGGENWRISRATVRSLRSPLPGNRRVPVGWVTKASALSRGLTARAIYPRADLVHRMKVGLPPAPGRDVITLHDIGPWRFSDETVPARVAREELQRARAVVTVSAFSAGEIAEMFGIAEPVVIHNGIDLERFAAAQAMPSSRLEEHGIRGEYVLAAGGSSERKNLEGLAAAWSRVRRVRPAMTLVLAGPEHPRRTALFKDIPGVAMIGRVPDDVLPALMAGARAVVIPSLYEGFGLPAVEGMAVGVPVVAMRASSLPEVLGEAGVLVEPTTSGLAEGIEWATSGDSDIDRRVELGRSQAEQFSWERSAQQHAELWRRLVSE